MKYGARNQLEAVVTGIKKGDVMGQVTLSLPVESVMGSVMTMDSIHGLNLKEGDTVQLIVKAVNVLVVKE